jgi:hypothetical protein
MGTLSLGVRRIHLLLIYGKGEKENLTPQDLRRVRALLEEIGND